jgi:hypothetical protein
MEEQLIAPCGMNCCLCINYQSMKNDLKSRGVRKKYCPGCNPRGENCVYMGDQCELLAKGKIRFCYEYEVFPCKRLKTMNKRYRTKYHMSMIENLEFIRDNSIELFLKGEEIKWLCHECGGVISWIPAHP